MSDLLLRDRGHRISTHEPAHQIRHAIAAGNSCYAWHASGWRGVFCLHSLFLLSVSFPALGNPSPPPIRDSIQNFQFVFLQLGKYFPPTGKVIFCALPNHTTKVRSHTLPDKFTCYLAVRASLRFALLRGHLLGVLAAVGQMDIPVVLTFGPFLHRLSATRLPIMPHISFPLQSGNVNSEPFTCDLRTGRSIGTMGWRMSFLRNDIAKYPIICVFCKCFENIVPFSKIIITPVRDKKEFIKSW